MKSFIFQIDIFHPIYVYRIVLIIGKKCADQDSKSIFVSGFIMEICYIHRIFPDEFHYWLTVQLILAGGISSPQNLRKAVVLSKFLQFLLVTDGYILNLRAFPTYTISYSLGRK